jgi:hypothetical protein
MITSDQVKRGDITPAEHTGIGGKNDHVVDPHRSDWLPHSGIVGVLLAPHVAHDLRCLSENVVGAYEFPLVVDRPNLRQK